MTGIDRDIKHLNHILEIPRPVVFVNCCNCDTTKSYLGNNPAWNKDDKEVVNWFSCLMGHSVCQNTKTVSSLSTWHL